MLLWCKLPRLLFLLLLSKKDIDLATRPPAFDSRMLPMVEDRESDSMERVSVWRTYGGDARDDGWLGVSDISLDASEPDREREGDAKKRVFSDDDDENRGVCGPVKGLLMSVLLLLLLGVLAFILKLLPELLVLLLLVLLSLLPSLLLILKLILLLLLLLLVLCWLPSSLPVILIAVPLWLLTFVFILIAPLL